MGFQGETAAPISEPYTADEVDAIVRETKASMDSGTMLPSIGERILRLAMTLKLVAVKGVTL